MMIFIATIVTITFLMIAYILYSQIVNNIRIKDMIVDDELNDFQNEDIAFDAASNMMAVVNIALYKMYNDLEITDYDSIAESLQKTVNEMLTNQEVLREWDKNLAAYIKDIK